MPEASEDPVATIVRYHERTKHRIHQYARSLGYLDWDTQPDPFRTYAGAPPTALLSPAIELDGPLFDEITREGGADPREISAASLSQLLFDSLAISAWKRYETSRWSLRCNPSSGNLHPTEAYLVLPRVSGFTDTAGVHHYDVKHHRLELRRPLPDELFARLVPATNQDTFLIGLTSIHWREAWKYGERAFRYCQHDVGHAIGAIAYSASALGWQVRIVESIGDDDLARWLGLDEAPGVESEVPDVLLVVSSAKPAGRPVSITSDELESAAIGSRPILGVPNALSSDHVTWEAIAAAFAATHRPRSRHERFALSESIEHSSTREPPRPALARALFRQRRSAVDFDGMTGITSDAFFRICARSMPRRDQVPFAAFTHEPAIHPVFFVHRVAGVSPGLYVLPRNESAAPRLRAAMKESFRWESVAGAPKDLPLRCLEIGDVRNGASFIACQQAIASDGAFAVGMLAEFEPRLRERGAWFYRTMHHEAGALGQTLYLEAEALGIRGTGIGCFFDDEMHTLLGLRDRRFQTIYHFTIGGPVDDPRIQTE